MTLKQVLKPNLIKITITLILAFLIFIVGIIFFKNPVWLKIGCAPNPGCPYCEICMSWGFPEIINLYSLPLLALLYVISLGIYSIAKEKSKHFELNMITLSFVVLCIFVIFGYFYYRNWKGRCRAFALDSLPSNTLQHQVELRCPQLLNPFTWSEFQEEWENKN